MKSRKQWDRLLHINRQVTHLEGYSGKDKVLCNAKKIAQLTANLPIPPAVTPVPPTVINRDEPGVAASSSTDPTPPETPLYLPEITTGTTWVISMAPLNSSGDIYHILAYLMILQARDRPLPRVQLNYDVDPNETPTHSTLTVGDQVKRSIDFAATLGMAGHFTQVKLDYNKTGREGTRQKQLEKHFTERSGVEDIRYIDQMATTALISHEILAHGIEPVTHTIQQGFSRRDARGFPLDARNAVDRYVGHAMRQIAELAKSEEQPLIVLHVRHSSTANNHLNLPDSFIRQLAICLHRQEYQVCFILADDRKVKARYAESCATETGASFVVLEPFKQKDLLIASVDYTKQAHLQLLQGLRSYGRTRGVIGNTSGTLDIAALIGMTTYCIHQFTKTRLSYQECRLYFQLAFMSLGALVNRGHDYVDNDLQGWLDEPRPRRGIGLFDQPADTRPVPARIDEKKQDPGYSKMFYYSFFSKGEKRAVEMAEPSEVIRQLSNT
ncbi:hypothetical protein [Legionella sp. CNM-4043-24]|uniref:hypothetical protein n=1 Tax=Legionella sp. CNM-4043-24 TaxID=3421646 RepID=UPI00403ABC88